MLEMSGLRYASIDSMATHKRLAIDITSFGAGGTAD